MILLFRSKYQSDELDYVDNLMHDTPLLSPSLSLDADFLNLALPTNLSSFGSNLPAPVVSNKLISELEAAEAIIRRISCR